MRQAVSTAAGSDAALTSGTVHAEAVVAGAAGAPQRKQDSLAASGKAERPMSDLA